MKSIKTLLFLLTWASCLTLHAQWLEKSNGFNGGSDVWAITSKGTDLFMGTTNGVYRSTDNGSNWTPVNTGMVNIIVYSLAVSGGNLFAGTLLGGVFLSTDNGASWNAVNTGLTNLQVRSLLVSGANLFAGTAGGGVFLSTNNGASWTEMNTGLTNLLVTTLFESGTNLFAGTSGGGVFLSTNNGASWAAVNTGLNLDVRALTQDGANLFAGTSGGVFLSTNNGTTWTAVNTGLTNLNINSLLVNGANLFAGTSGGGVFLSTNNGTSWTAVNTGLTMPGILDMTMIGGNLFSTGFGGCFLSTNNGASWTPVNNGLTNAVPLSMIKSGGDLFAGSSSGVFLSTNNGMTWTAMNTGLTNTVVHALEEIGGNLFAGTDRGGVFKSTDNGVSWTPVNSGLTNTRIRNLTASGSNLFAGTFGGGVFLSTNSGTSWTAVNSGLTDLTVYSFLATGGNLFAGTFNGCFLSTNNGASWTAVNTGLTNKNIQSLTVSGSNLFVGTFGGGVFLSTNNGTSWAPANTGLTDNWVFSLTAIGGNILAGTYPTSGLFLSTNNGTSWTNVGTGLPKAYTISLIESGGELFAGVFGRGVWSRSLSELGIIPIIASFNPSYGPIGTTVTITGTNFDPLPTNNIVYFGATRASVTAATSTQLTVTVPVGATYQPITVGVGGLIAYSSKPFVTTFTGGGAIDVCSLAPKIDFITGTTPLSTYIGDLDGDGKVDLVTGNQNANSISVYRNTSTSGTIDASSFTTKIDFIVGTQPYLVVVSDIDGDGKADIITANNISNTVSVLRNTSTTGSITTSSFAPKVDFSVGLNPYSVAVGDLDADGKPELVVSNFSSSSISVFKNIGVAGTFTTGSFASKVDFISASGPSSIMINDLDGDGKPDLATGGAGTTISVLRNTTTAGVIDGTSFAAKVDFTTGSYARSMTIGDLDSDDKPDLVFANFNSNSISILKNTSSMGTITSGSFAAKVDFVTAANPHAVSIGDIDGDGKPDLAVANGGNSSIGLFKNISSAGSITSGSFSARVDFSTATGPANIAIGDLDGDGKPEVVVGVGGSNVVSVFRNKIGETPAPTITSFTPTSGPVGTSITISGTNYDPVPLNNIVKFNGVDAVIAASTITDISTTVPIGAVTGSISVTVGCITATSSSNFTVRSNALQFNGIDQYVEVGDQAAVNLTGAFTLEAWINPDPVQNTPIGPRIIDKYTWTVGGYNLVLNDQNGISVDAWATDGTRMSLEITGTQANIFDGEWHHVAGMYDGNELRLYVDFCLKAALVIGAKTINTITTPLRIGYNFDGSFNWWFNGGIANPRVWNVARTQAELIAGSSTVPSSSPGLVVDYKFTEGGGYTAQDFSPNNFTAQLGTSTAANPAAPVWLLSQPFFAPLSLPTITSFSPASGLSGTSVIITGTNFSTPFSGAIEFNGIPAPIIASTATTITVTVPVGATTGPIEATIGCNAALSLTDFTVELDREITVYNGLSPNGDGLNEFFKIQYIEILPETQSNQVFIYNRWGDEVFSVRDYNNDDRVFKGDSKGGKKLPTGTYFYKVVFSSGKKTMSGFLELKY